MSASVFDERCAQLENLILPRYDSLPSFGIYVDQLVSFVNDTVSFSYMPDEKPLTASMVNNYVKQGLLPKPNKKKYSQYHIAALIAICILKKIFSIHEIAQLIQIQMDAYQMGQAYDSFIDSLERCLAQVFFDKPSKRTGTASSNSDALLVERAVLTFSNKLYVQIKTALLTC